MRTFINFKFVTSNSEINIDFSFFVAYWKTEIKGWPDTSARGFTCRMKWHIDGESRRWRREHQSSSKSHKLRSRISILIKILWGLMLSTFCSSCLFNFRLPHMKHISQKISLKPINWKSCNLSLQFKTISGMCSNSSQDVNKIKWYRSQKSPPNYLGIPKSNHLCADLPHLPRISWVALNVIAKHATRRSANARLTRK